MKIQIKDISAWTKELTVEVNDAQREKGHKQAIAHIRKDVKLPGFRKGKASDKVLERHVGPEYIAAQANIESINIAFQEAAAKEHLEIIDAPRDLDVVKDEPLTFTVKVDVRPSVKLDDGYKKIKIKKEEVKVTDEEIEEVITSTKQRFTTYKQDDKAVVAEGDRATINFRGVEPKDETPLENTDAKGHAIVVGSKSFIPGFEEELIGLKTGDKKDFVVTFPKDYHHEPFKNKKVKFYVEITKVEKAEVPEITPEFTEQLRGKKMTEKEFRDDIKKMLTQEKEDAIRTKQEDEYLDEAAKKYVKDELPPLFIKHEQDIMFDEMKQRLMMQGLQVEDYLAHMKKSEDDVKAEWKEEAMKRANKRFILQELLQHANIEVTDADIAEEVEVLAARFEDEARKKQVKEMYSNKDTARKNLASRVELKKFFATVLA